jgi:hypothetical protein
MRKSTILLILICILAFCATPGIAGEMERERPAEGMRILDLLVVRPLSIVISTASTAFYIVTVPITYPAGVSESAARVLVEAPWRYTGMRYLGDFHHYKDGHPITTIDEE